MIERIGNRMEAGVAMLCGGIKKTAPVANQNISRCPGYRLLSRAPNQPDDAGISGGFLTIFTGNFILAYLKQWKLLLTLSGKLPKA
jgi:hypothetical protein